MRNEYITLWDNCDMTLPVGDGSQRMRYDYWCEREAARIRLASPERNAHVEYENGQCAVFADLLVEYRER